MLRTVSCVLLCEAEDVGGKRMSRQNCAQKRKFVTHVIRLVTKSMVEIGITKS